MCCFKDNNINYFRSFNLLFFLIHVVLLITCFATYSSMNGTLPTYYMLYISSYDSVEVKLLIIPVLLHTFAILFHLVFMIKSNYIVDIMYSKNFTNPYHWVYQYIIDGLTIVAIMLIQGIQFLETFYIVLVVYAAVIILCFYQDMYLHRNYIFEPTISPHVFAIMLYILLVIFIIFKSTKYTNTLQMVKINIVTMITLLQSGLSVIILQKMHINYSRVEEIKNMSTQIRNENDNNEKCEEIDMQIESNNELLDMEVHELRRGINYELVYSINNTLFSMIITWVIINLTRSNKTLN